MKKRFLSLLCALTLCLGLLPVTAFAEGGGVRLKRFMWEAWRLPEVLAVSFTPQQTETAKW